MTIDSPSTLYLPDTRIAPATAASLLLPFYKLFSYRPVEGTPPVAQSLAAAGLIEAYPPAPLGKDIDRFRRLLKDMQTHATEYRQAYLSLPAAGAEEDAEAGWRQVARRLKGAAPDPEAEDEGLWRARLYLALTENHAALQEELDAGIQTIARRETELLRQLHGEEEEIEEPPLSPTGPAPTVPIREEQLLAAWGLLFLADVKPDRPWLLATAQEASAALLLDEYQRAAGRPPENLLALALPQLVDPGELFPETRLAFRTGARELLAHLGDFLTEAAFAEPATNDTGSRQAATAIAAAWREAVAPFAGTLTQKPVTEGDASGPAAGATLTFYRMPGMSFPRLFSLFCRREGKESAGTASPHAVLAVLGL